MVSVSGYVIGEYVFYIAGTYVLIAMLILTRCIVDVLVNRAIWKTLIVAVVLSVVVYIVYGLGVRIGVVMIINGALLMRLVIDGWTVISSVYAIEKVKDDIAIEVEVIES